MKPIELLYTIGLCNTTNDENILRETVSKILDTRDPYYICDFVENVNKVHKKKYLKLFEDAMLEIGDIVHSYEFMYLLTDMRVQDFDLKRFEEAVKESGNAKLMMYSLVYIEGVDQESMLQALYDTKNAKYIKQLSTDEEHESLKVNERPEYKERLEEAENYYYFPKSLEKVKPEDKTDISSLIKNVIGMSEGNEEERRKKAYSINELANYLQYIIEHHPQGLNVQSLRQAIELLAEAELEVAKDESICLYEFAVSVDMKDKTPIIDRVIQNGSAKYICYCLEYAPDLTEEAKNKLERALAQKHHNKYKVDSKEETKTE